MMPIEGETLLDRALEGEPAEVKARVRDLVIRLGIRPDDPFFIISIGLGHLQVLIKDGPQEWQDLFGSFEKELSEWATTNLRTLSLLTQRTETMERLATSSEKLSSILTDLTQACSTLVKQLPQSNQQLASSVKQLESSSKELATSLNNIQNSIITQEQQIGKLTESVESTRQQLILTTQNRKTSRNGSGRGNRFALVCLLIVCVVVVISSGFNLYLINTTNQRTQWLLQKANRLECITGIKVKGSPECQQVVPEQAE